MNVLRKWPAIAVLASAAACAGESFTQPGPTPSPTGPPVLDRAAVIDALDYWQAAVGITYVLIDAHTEPRLFIRPGTDGLGPQGGGRGLIDGTHSDDNRARSGLVVFEPGGGQYCRIGAMICRMLYRHEIGHALGFLGHSDAGLMSGIFATVSDTLSDRERRMMLALYSLPHGAIVEPDGRWSVHRTGPSGVLDDAEAAAGIIAWNMNAAGGASFRQIGVISRWELPVRVFLQP